MTAWRTYYALENRKRNKAQAAAGISEEERLRLGAINAELGMTDRSKFPCEVINPLLTTCSEPSFPLRALVVLSGLASRLFQD
jgi:hypothetical protein